MHWKEVSCPACGERMYAPGNREEIFCLYCGKKFLLDREETDTLFEAKCFSTQVEAVLNSCERWLEAFSCEKYPLAFLNFCERHSEFLEQTDRGIRQQKSPVLIEEILARTKERIKKEATLRKPEELQYSFNTLTAVFLIPAIIHKSGSQGRMFCEALAREWALSFKNSRIKVTDYESIFKGFKRNLFEAWFKRS